MNTKPNYPSATAVKQSKEQKPVSYLTCQLLIIKIFSIKASWKAATQFPFCLLKIKTVAPKLGLMYLEIFMHLYISGVQKWSNYNS